VADDALLFSGVRAGVSGVGIPLEQRESLQIRRILESAFGGACAGRRRPPVGCALHPLYEQLFQRGTALGDGSFDCDLCKQHSLLCDGVRKGVDEK